jgi:hypothetical protein
MSAEHRHLSRPGENVIGPFSPINRSIDWLDEFFASNPTPDLGTDASRSCGLLAANHLLQLLKACMLLNVSGMHSSAVVLLRSLEDVLDCFAAVTLVPGAAEDWTARTLKPSEAAKRWTALRDDEFTARGESTTLAAYRKSARSTFNMYAHCTYDLCTWDLYQEPVPDSESDRHMVTIELNRAGLVIDSNAHAIDAHLTAHLLEFMGIVPKAYHRRLHRSKGALSRLRELTSHVETVMKRHDSHGCQDVRTPPEVRGLLYQAGEPESE